MHLYRKCYIYDIIKIILFKQFHMTFPTKLDLVWYLIESGRRVYYISYLLIQKSPSVCCRCECVCVCV